MREEGGSTYKFLCPLRAVLVGLKHRSTIYLPPGSPIPYEEQAEVLDQIDKEYTLHMFYGSRKIKQHLIAHGYIFNRKQVQQLVRKLGLAGMAPGPNISEQHPQYKIYPYLLRGMHVSLPKHIL
jgi:putative transposase